MLRLDLLSLDVGSVSLKQILQTFLISRDFIYVSFFEAVFHVINMK